MIFPRGPIVPFVLLVLVGLLAPAYLVAQGGDSSKVDSNKVDNNKVDNNKVDSGKIDRGPLVPNRLDSAAVPKVIPSDYVISKSPTRAVLYSIIPGGGQLYNEQYWKVPLFLLPAGYFAWRAIYYHGKFRTVADEIASLSTDDARYIALKPSREFYRDERDLAVGYYLSVTALCMIDAYVGAHLFDFTSGAETSSRLYIRPDLTGLGVVVQW